MSTYTATATTTNTTTKFICSSRSNTAAVLCNSSPISSPKRDHNQHRVSESESEDSFIVFQDISPCKSAPSRDAFRFRSRQVSECSSDSDFIVFENGSRDTSFCYETNTTDDDDDDDDDDRAQPNGKRVKFNLRPIVHEIHAWKFAYAQARRGQWHHIGWDRERFERRINDLSEIVSPILVADHRHKIYSERFHEKF